MVKDLVLGFDCGGTKTQVDVAEICTKAELTLSESFSVGSMNVNSAGREGVLSSLEEAFALVGPERLSRVGSICFGAAGISNPLAREVFMEGTRRGWMMNGILTPFPIPLLIGDHQAALWGAHAGSDGMILIAGTGSVCCGKKTDSAGTSHEARAGGYGHLIDDEGSGYALGRDVLAAVVQAEDGRIPPTAMRQAVFAKLGISSVQELVGFVYGKETTKKDIAALAPILNIGLEAGERAAEEILDRASYELCRLVVPVAERLDLTEGYLSFCGSVLTKSPRMAEAVKYKLQDELPSLKIREPLYDAAFGACLAAVKQV